MANTQKTTGDGRYTSETDADTINKRIASVDVAQSFLTRHTGADDMDTAWLMQVLTNRREDLVKQQTKAKLQQIIDLMLPNVALADRVLRGGEVRAYKPKNDTHLEVEVSVFSVDALKTFGMSISSTVSSAYMGFNLTSYTPIVVYLPLPVKWLTATEVYIADDLADYKKHLAKLKVAFETAESDLRIKKLELSSANEVYMQALQARNVFTFDLLGTL